MGAICAYCCAGPRKLSNLYGNPFVKNKCEHLVFVDTLGKYMRINQQQTEKRKRMMKEKGEITKAKPTKRSTSMEKAGKRKRNMSEEVEFII
jgi:hypothetical protein